MERRSSKVFFLLFFGGLEGISRVFFYFLLFFQGFSEIFKALLGFSWTLRLFGVV